MPPVLRNNAITIHPPGHVYEDLSTVPAVRNASTAYAIFAEEGAAKALNAALCELLDRPGQLNRGVLSQHKPALGALRDALSACILSHKPQRAEVAA